MTDQEKTREQLIEELAACRRRLAELEQAHPADTRLGGEGLLRTVIDSLPDYIYVKDAQSRFVLNNHAHLHALGAGSQAALIGRTDFDVFPQDLAERYYADDQAAMQSGESLVTREEEICSADGTTRYLWTTRVAIRDDEGHVTGLVGISRDITQRKQAEDALLEHRIHLEEMVDERTRTVRQQAEEILEISTPTLQVWDGILVAPLIGSLDSQRAQHFMEVLLNAVVDTASEIALLDITGVPAIDTQTALHLIETISALRLLGASVVLTGVRPEIAQTLVHLGIDLSGITTRPSLAAGLRVALDRLGMQLQNGRG